MKTTVAPYEYRAMCLRIVPRFGAAIRLTSYPTDLRMSNAQVYVTSSGYQFTGYQSATGTSPASFDFDGIAGLAGISRDTIASGVFDGARAYLFAVDWRNPVEDYEPIVASILGKATLVDGAYKMEEMALLDALNQSVGKTYAPQCPKVFGGQEFAGCKINIAAITATGALTAVASARQITDSARAEAADYWAWGTIQFTSGPNAGLKALEIKSFAAGVITTFEPFYYLPQVGDSYTIVPGCRKRLEDCRDKWNNVVNFGGFPTVPTSSIYTERGSK